MKLLNRATMHHCFTLRNKYLNKQNKNTKHKMTVNAKILLKMSYETDAVTFPYRKANGTLPVCVIDCYPGKACNMGDYVEYDMEIRFLMQVVTEFFNK